MKENKDYQLVPTENDRWSVKVLSGPFTETLFSFGTITVNEDVESVSFNMEMISHEQGDDWDYDNDIDWHKVGGEILHDIFMRSLDNENPSDGTAG